MWSHSTLDSHPLRTSHPQQTWQFAPTTSTLAVTECATCLCYTIGKAHHTPTTTTSQTSQWSYSGFLQQRLLCSQSHNCRPSSRPSSSSSTGLRRHLSIGRHHHQSLSRHLKLPGCRMFRRHQSHDLRPPSSLLNGSEHLQTTEGHPQPQQHSNGSPLLLIL